MKKYLYLTAALLAVSSLTACAATTKQKTKNTSEDSSSKTVQSSSSSSSSSTASNSSAASIMSSEGEKILQDRYSIETDDGSSLQYIPDAANMSELDAIKSFHVSEGVRILVNGEDLYANEPKTSYEEVVAALGAPSNSIEPDDPGNGLHFWDTAQGRVMANFSNNELANLSFDFRDSQPAKTSYSSITVEDTPQTALAKLGRPESLTRSKRSTTYTYKYTGDQKFSITVQNNQITGFTSPSEYEQAKKIADSALQRQ